MRDEFGLRKLRKRQSKGEYFSSNQESKLLIFFPKYAIKKQ